LVSCRIKWSLGRQLWEVFALQSPRSSNRDRKLFIKCSTLFATQECRISSKDFSLVLHWMFHSRVSQLKRGTFCTLLLWLFDAIIHWWVDFITTFRGLTRPLESTHFLFSILRGVFSPFLKLSLLFHHFLIADLLLFLNVFIHQIYYYLYEVFGSNFPFPFIDVNTVSFKGSWRVNSVILYSTRESALIQFWSFWLWRRWPTWRWRWRGWSCSWPGGRSLGCPCRFRSTRGIHPDCLFKPLSHDLFFLRRQVKYSVLHRPAFFNSSFNNTLIRLLMNDFGVSNFKQLIFQISLWHSGWLFSQLMKSVKVSLFIKLISNRFLSYLYNFLEVWHVISEFYLVSSF